MSALTSNDPFRSNDLHDYGSLPELEHVSASSSWKIAQKDLEQLQRTLTYENETSDLRLPDLDTSSRHTLEPITPNVTPQDGNKSTRLAFANTDPTTWDIPQALLVANDPVFRAWRVSLVLPTETSDGGEDEAVPWTLPGDAINHDGDTPAVSADYLFHCLIRLAHGSSSPLFFQTQSERHFTIYNNGHFNVIGVHADVRGDLVSHCLAIGARSSRLRHFVAETFQAATTTPINVSLASSVAELLDADRLRLAQAARSIKSSPHLRRELEYTDTLAVFLCHFEEVFHNLATDHTPLVTLGQAVPSLQATAHTFRRSLEAILRRIFRPAIESLLSNAGFSVNSNIIVDDHAGTDEITRKAVFEIDHPFVSHSDLILVHSISDGINMLREASSDSMSNYDTRTIDPSLHDQILSGKIDADEVLQLARNYEENVRGALADHSTVTIIGKEGPTKSTDSIKSTAGNDKEDAFIELGNQFLKRPTVQDDRPLSDLVCAFNKDINEAQDETSDTEHVLFFENGGLLAPLRPILEVQSRLVNARVLRYLYRDQQLLDHLSALHQFHLCGNGSFVRSLQAVLFEGKSASAKDRLPIAGTLELRMGDLSAGMPTVDPGLRLKLATLLEDTYVTRPHPLSEKPQCDRRTDHQIPGAVSFGMRNLSDPDIRSTLDPLSPYAFSFLHLQYHPPAALAFLFGSTGLDSYARIFRFLLALLRQMRLVSRMPVSTPNKAALDFTTRARHVITVLATHIFNLGINSPWTRFMSELEEIKTALDEEDEGGDSGRGVVNQISLSDLAESHGQLVDDIESRLGLKDDQTDVLGCIENIFALVLRGYNLLSPYEDGMKTGVAEVTRELQDAISCLAEKCRTFAESVRLLGEDDEENQEVSTEEDDDSDLDRGGVDADELKVDEWAEMTLGRYFDHLADALS